MKDLGIIAPDILIPSARVDLTKWAVVACDQYTANPAYWRAIEDRVKGAYSALNLILPEIYLNEPREAFLKRVSLINKNMEKYLSDGIFSTLKKSFILTKRQIKNKYRTGLVAALDLEKYSYAEDSKSLIRATEGTIAERLPVRVKIREGARLELPHIMVLINDPNNTVIEPLNQNRRALKKLYDFELDNGCGNISGYRITDTDGVLKNIERLFEQNPEQILFAIGDGNHSLAAAKSAYENLKAVLPEKERLSHPFRYALAEIVNLYDEAIAFEPIHRLVRCADTADFAGKLKELTKNFDGKKYKVFSKDKTDEITLGDRVPDAYKAVQDFIDAYKIYDGAASVDYVHGLKDLQKAARAKGAVGIEMPALKKEELFGFVSRCGSLPRKSFSMGEADEKRYYLEARII
jgi:uncharacterized protein (DUF1015 family)